MLKKQIIKMQIASEYACAFCGKLNLTFVDISRGVRQKYLEKCEFCRRPNILYIKVDQESLDVQIDSEYKDQVS